MIMTRDKKIKLIGEKFKSSIGSEIYSRFTMSNFKIGEKYLLVEIYKSTARFEIDGVRIETNTQNLQFFDTVAERRKRKIKHICN